MRHTLPRQLLDEVRNCPLKTITVASSFLKLFLAKLVSPSESFKYCQMKVSENLWHLSNAIFKVTRDLQMQNLLAKASQKSHLSLFFSRARQTEVQNTLFYQLLHAAESFCATRGPFSYVEKMQPTQSKPLTIQNTLGIISRLPVFPPQSNQTLKQFFPLLPASFFTKLDSSFSVADYVSLVYSVIAGDFQTRKDGFVLLRWVLGTLSNSSQAPITSCVWKLLMPIFKLYVQGHHGVNLSTPSFFVLHQLNKKNTTALFLASSQVFPLLAHRSFRTMLWQVWLGKVLFQVVSARTRQIFVSYVPEATVEAVREVVFKQIHPLFQKFQERAHKFVATPVMGKSPSAWMVSFLEDSKIYYIEQVFLFCLHYFSFPLFLSQKTPKSRSLDVSECGFCGQTFENAQDLREHLCQIARRVKTVFDPGFHSRAKKSMSCPACHSVFDSARNRENHIWRTKKNIFNELKPCCRGQIEGTRKVHKQLVQEFAEQACEILKKICQARDISLHEVIRFSTVDLEPETFPRFRFFREMLGPTVSSAFQRKRFPSTVMYHHLLVSDPEKGPKESEDLYSSRIKCFLEELEIKAEQKLAKCKYE